MQPHADFLWAHVSVRSRSYGSRDQRTQGHDFFICHLPENVAFHLEMLGETAGQGAQDEAQRGPSASCSQLSLEAGETPCVATSIQATGKHRSLRVGGTLSSPPSFTDGWTEAKCSCRLHEITQPGTDTAGLVTAWFPSSQANVFYTFHS